MNWLLFFQVFLSVLVAFLTMGGSWFVFTIDQLKEYEIREKLFRVTVGFIMITVGLSTCVLYKSYLKDLLV